MKIHAYTDENWQPVADLFSVSFGSRCRSIAEPTRQGFMRDILQEWMDCHVVSGAWIATDQDTIVGFISAHITEDDKGIITCPVCPEGNPKVLYALLDRSESFLKERSVANANIIGLSKEYGVAFGGDLHIFLLNAGYRSYDSSRLEYVMEIDLTKVTSSPAIDDYCLCNERDGYVFEFLREEHAGSLKEFAPEWSLEGLSKPIANEPIRFPFAICRNGDTVVGYCGTCHSPNKYGQAGWSFILLRGIESAECPYVGRGIGAVLLFMANNWLKGQGAIFQTLVTGIGNRTQRLYRKAGYRYCFVQPHDIYKML